MGLEPTMGSRPRRLKVSAARHYGDVPIVKDRAAGTAVVIGANGVESDPPRNSTTVSPSQRRRRCWCHRVESNHPRNPYQRLRLTEAMALLVRMARFERASSRFPTERSTAELHPDVVRNTRCTSDRIGLGRGTRTRVILLPKQVPCRSATPR